MIKKFTMMIKGISYPVEVRQYKDVYMVEIREVQGSILRKLDNRPEVTGNRFSDEHRFMDRDATHPVEMHWEEGLIYFLGIEAESHKEAFDFVLNWIDGNFYRIEAIGWETLYKWRG